jgi:hypothetical protein
MPKVQEFYSINETKKQSALRVYHNNSACVPGKDIPAVERRPGKGPGKEVYRLCDDCDKLNKLNK